MLTPYGGGRSGLEIRPGLWAGVGLVRGGAGTALVGSRQKVADPIKAHQAVGVEEFVLSWYPHLEEGVLVRGPRPADLPPGGPWPPEGRTRARRRSGCRTVRRGTPAC